MRFLLGVFVGYNLRGRNNLLFTVLAVLVLRSAYGTNNACFTSPRKSRISDAAWSRYPLPYSVELLISKTRRELFSDAN